MFIRVILALGLFGTAANAGEPGQTVRASLLSNDFLVGQRDRWRTASYTSSWLFPEASLEFLLRTETITPFSGAGQKVHRPYVGILAPGLFFHRSVGGWDMRLGGELTIVGPQTRVSDVQEFFHKFIGASAPLGTRSQLGDDILPTVSLGFTRIEPFSTRRQNILTRPFVEIQSGAETLARFGANVIVGPASQAEFFARDTVSGFPLIPRNGSFGQGISLFAGGDIAYVDGSKFLPSSSGITHKRYRGRIRLGVLQSIRNWDFFLGFTWLTKEFSEQVESQGTSSLAITYRH